MIALEAQVYKIALACIKNNFPKYSYVWLNNNQVRIVNLEKKRIEEECQRLRDENGVFRERLHEAARVQNSPSASQYMSQEIEVLASQVEELTEELINERQRNTTLERSLQGPSTVDGITQTDEKGFN